MNESVLPMEDGVVAEEVKKLVQVIDLGEVEVTYETEEREDYKTTLGKKLVSKGIGMGVKFDEDKFVGCATRSFVSDSSLVYSNVVDRAVACVRQVLTPKLLGEDRDGQLHNLPAKGKKPLMIVTVQIVAQPDDAAY